MAGNIFQLQTGAVATGNGNTANVKGYATIGFQVSGTFSGTVTFEGSIDGTNWISLMATKQSDDSRATTATAAGIYYATVAHLISVRARISLYTSGSINVLAWAAAGATCFK